MFCYSDTFWSGGIASPGCVCASPPPLPFPRCALASVEKPLHGSSPRAEPPLEELGRSQITPGEESRCGEDSHRPPLLARRSASDRFLNSCDFEIKREPNVVAIAARISSGLGRFHLIALKRVSNAVWLWFYSDVCDSYLVAVFLFVCLVFFFLFFNPPAGFAALLGCLICCHVRYVSLVRASP